MLSKLHQARKKAATRARACARIRATFLEQDAINTLLSASLPAAFLETEANQ